MLYKLKYQRVEYFSVDTNYERGLSVSYKSPTGGGRFGVERFPCHKFYAS